MPPEHDFAKIYYAGGPWGGAISAIAITRDNDFIAFAGTAVGLYRTIFGQDEQPSSWIRLQEAPLGILALSVSPQYEIDHLLVAGTCSGIEISQDGGDTWQPARMPAANTTILCLCFSPQFAQDGILLAGTLEDGVLYSEDRGKTWGNRSFGLFDPAVYCLGISPHFAQDGIIFAGTETALYYTYNHARAWRQIEFPPETTPVLSLAVSPGYASDQTVLAGTENQGVFRSTDGGESWKQVQSQTEPANGILFLDQDRILAAGEDGIASTRNCGDTWYLNTGITGVLFLASCQEVVMAGTLDQGIWIKVGTTEWTVQKSLVARSFLGMEISPRFAQDQTIFFYGLQEGIWKTTDSGKTWECLNAELPSTAIVSLVLTGGNQDLHLVAASTEGLFASHDGGNTWEVIFNSPVTSTAISPDGTWLVIHDPHRGILRTTDAGKSWLPVTGPWDTGGKILTLSARNEGEYFIAWLESSTEFLSIWHGKDVVVQPVLRLAAGANPLVTFYIPSESQEHWFAGIGTSVWRFPEKQSTTLPGLAPGETIISLAGNVDYTETVLFASTGKRLFQSMDGFTWKASMDFEPEMAMSIAVSLGYAADRTVFVMAPGGKLYRVITLPLP